MSPTPSVCRLACRSRSNIWGGDEAVSDVLVIGAGGHARCVVDTLTAAGHRVVGVVGREMSASNVLGVPVVGTDDDLARLKSTVTSNAALGIGSVGSTAARRRAAVLAIEAGLGFEAVVHPAATVSPFASVGRGAYIAAGAIVGPGVRLGEFSIVNSGAVVDHDCEIGAFAHVAPGAVLAGDVRVGDDAHIGAGASVIQGLMVGARSLVGAGSVVTKDIRADVVAFGNPCRVKRG